MSFGERWGERQGRGQWGGGDKERGEGGGSEGGERERAHHSVILATAIPTLYED